MDIVEKRLDKLLQIDGVFYYSTETILESYFLPEDMGFETEGKEIRISSPLSDSDTEPDIWLQVDKELGQAYVKAFGIPHIFAHKVCYLGLNLESISEARFWEGRKSLENISKEVMVSYSYEFPETEHPPLEDIIDMDYEPFVKVMITKEFVYYLMGEEGDDNGTVKMYKKESGELVSDNYMACRDLYENLLCNRFEWINETLQYSRNAMLEEQRILLATEYYLSNSYPGKIPNLTFEGIHGAFNKELDQKLGFKLNEKELVAVHSVIKAGKTKAHKR